MYSNFDIDHPTMAEAKDYLNQLLQEAVLAAGDHVSTAKLTLSMEFVEDDSNDGAAEFSLIECKGKVEAKRVIESGSAFVRDLLITNHSGSLEAALPAQMSFDDMEGAGHDDD